MRINNYIKVMLVFLAFSAFACRTLPPVEFENSNQLFVERTVDKMNLGSTFPIPTGSAIVLVSIENDRTVDLPIVATVEDQLIRALLKNQYVVLERDSDMLKHLLKETHTTDYKNFYSVLSQKINVKDSSSASIELLKTHLKAADYIVSYRILECGLVYGRNVIDGNVERKGLVRLHVRVQRADSGEIVYADNLNGEYKDRVPSDFTQYYENYHYNYYKSEYPLQK